MVLDRKTFQYFLLAAFVLHAVVMTIQLRDHISKSDLTITKTIKVNFTPDSLANIASIQKKQIVQSEGSASSEKPKNEAFLSDKDRSFDRETLAKKVASFQNAGKGNATYTQTEAPKAQQTPKAEKRSLKDLKLSDVGMTASDFAPAQPNRAPASAGLENGDLNSNGLSATNDYVEEVALGDFTHLNTVEYKHYGFFHRIRQKLEQFWGNSLHEKANAIFRSGRRLPASDDLITSLQVTLNAKGEIVGVKILGTSGVRELDDAAIESFNQAGPFPNPPKDLLKGGLATIEWGFVVKS
ncbi:MAG: TonB family protein [Bacteriovoracaceae bacterium]